jgi:hypothetical protein
MQQSSREDSYCLLSVAVVGSASRSPSGQNVLTILPLGERENSPVEVPVRASILYGITVVGSVIVNKERLL